MTEMAKIKRNLAAVKIAEDILREFEPGSVEDMQGALKEIFGPMFEAMLKEELNNHLGYESNLKVPKETSNRRNGTSPKTLKTTMGEVPISAPRDIDGSFEPEIMSNSITSLFGLEDSGVEVCTEQLKAGVQYFRITLINRRGRCPGCGKFTKDIKEYKTKTIRHSIFLNEQALNHYRARRFCCPDRGKTFYEHDPFSSQYSRISDKTVLKVPELVKSYNEIFRSIARKVGLSVNEIITIIDEHVQVSGILFLPVLQSMSSTSPGKPGINTTL